jgi:hypothetical protein
MRGFLVSYTVSRVKAKLTATVAALVLSSSLHAQDFAPRLSHEAPVPEGRTQDTTTDSPAKVDRNVDFSATRTPLDPPKKTPPRPRSGGLDQPVDRPADSRALTADDASRAARDAPVQSGLPAAGTAGGFIGADRVPRRPAALAAKQRGTPVLPANSVEDDEKAASDARALLQEIRRLQHASPPPTPKNAP